MKEFVSKLEELIEAEELLFKPTPGFGNTYKKFLGQSIAHPAKMNTLLLTFLIETFTKEGETVLDPMSGSGSTGVVAALHGRDAVCVELEEKFYKWMEEARKKVECQQTLARKGRIRNVLGDARKLSILLGEADVVVTSPPYASEAVDNRKTFNKTMKGIGRKDGYERVTAPSTIANQSRYSNDQNIANLRHGKVDVVVTSPPYARDKGGEKGMLVHDEKRKNDETLIRTYGENPKNIDNLPLGKVDSIITSPPYAEQIHGTGQSREKVLQLLREKGYSESWIKAHYCSPYTNVKITEEEGYSKDEENIGNLKFADCIVTSPPYSEILGAGHRSKLGNIKAQGSSYQEFGEEKSEDNIGNLKKETYLEAMLTVYHEMWQVLKPDGKAIIIIKPFIRNKKIVDLPYQTWLLLKRAGFKLTRLFKLRLKQQSFWRILYTKKHPEVPQIKHEYVLVTQKLVVANPLVVNGNKKEKP